VLKLMFAALIRAAERWRGLRFSEFELRQIAVVRKELDAEYEATIIRSDRPSHSRLSSKITPLPAAQPEEPSKIKGRQSRRPFLCAHRPQTPAMTKFLVSARDFHLSNDADPCILRTRPLLAFSL
jgi:hypothetical protein